MSNDTNMRFSLESQEDLSFKSGPLLSDDDLKFNSLNPYQYTDNEVKIKSISANGTPLEPDADKNVDIPVISDLNLGTPKIYNPGLVRIIGSGMGIRAARLFIGEGTSHYYDGCLVIEGATQSDIDMRKNPYRPITPYTLKYAVESITKPVTLGTNEVIEDNSITINLLNNKKYILTQDTTYPNMTIEYTFDSSDPSIDLKGFYEFNAGLIFKTPSDIDCNFIYPSSFYFISDDAEDGVFAPQKNMVYEIMFSVEAKTGEKPYYIARVSGYEAPTNEVV